MIFLTIILIFLILCLIGTVEKANERMNLIINRQNEIIKVLKNSKK